MIHSAAEKIHNPSPRRPFSVACWGRGRCAAGEIIGSVEISGAPLDKHEICAVQGIGSAELVANTNDPG